MFPPMGCATNFNIDGIIFCRNMGSVEIMDEIFIPVYELYPERTSSPPSPVKTIFTCLVAKFETCQVGMPELSPKGSSKWKASLFKASPRVEGYTVPS